MQQHNPPVICHLGDMDFVTLVAGPNAAERRLIAGATCSEYRYSWEPPFLPEPLTRLALRPGSRTISTTRNLGEFRHPNVPPLVDVDFEVPRTVFRRLLISLGTEGDTYMRVRRVVGHVWCCAFVGPHVHSVVGDGTPSSSRW
jgi:hypothetical protein